MLENLLIENKEKYRLAYGMPWSDPEWDYDISDVEWKGKGRIKIRRISCQKIK